MTGRELIIFILENNLENVSIFDGDTLSKYGDYEWFISEDPYIPKEKPLPDFMNIPEGTDEEVELPWN